MKRTLEILIVFLCGVIFANGQTTNIPDAVFEQQLITLGIDSNGLNGNILNTDAQAVTTLTLTGTTAITNLTGLEAFTNIINLDIGTNSVSTVPLTTLIALETFILNNNSLTTLDLSQNTALRILNLSKSGGSVLPISLTTLDLTTNVKLENLTVKFFSTLTNLILPVTPTLTTISLSRLGDPTLDFSSLSNLEYLTISQSAVTVLITLSSTYTSLKKLEISTISIPYINLSNFVNLESIRLTTTYIENLILPISTTLTDIDVYIHNIQNPISFADLPNLKNLKFSVNGSVPLVADITQNLKLEKINLSINDMASIDLTHNPLAKEINVGSNNLTNLDVSQNTAVTRLSAQNNQLPIIDLSANTELVYLYLNNNLLPVLDIDTCTKLYILDISNNLFTNTGLNLTNNRDLLYLKASFNQIQSLNITQNPRLATLLIDHNLFAGSNDIIQQYYNGRLAAGGIGASQRLDVSFNQLSGIIPNIASLVNTGPTAGTNYFEYQINNNNFEFGDFEMQHLNFVGYRTSTGVVNLPTLRDYDYAPQAKVDLVQAPTVTAGNSITLTTTVSGAQNHYQWFKDGVAIVGAADSPN